MQVPSTLELRARDRCSICIGHRLAAGPLATEAPSSAALSTFYPLQTILGRLPSRARRNQVQVLGNQTHSAVLLTNRKPESPATTLGSNSLLLLVRSTSEVLEYLPTRRTAPELITSPVRLPPRWRSRSHSFSVRKTRVMFAGEFDIFLLSFWAPPMSPARSASTHSPQRGLR
jgi:hypothetical protein